MSNSSVFKSRLKVLRSSADLQLYDSEFQTEEALTQNAFADNISVIRGTISRPNSLSADPSLSASKMVLMNDAMPCSRFEDLYSPITITVEYNK